MSETVRPVTRRHWHSCIMNEICRMVSRLAPTAKATGLWNREEVMSRVRDISDEVRRPLGLPGAEEGNGREPVFEAHRYNMRAIFEDIMESVHELAEMLVPMAATSGDWVPREVADLFSDIAGPLAEALGLELGGDGRPRLKSTETSGPR
jgi:hypothetical protein